MTLNFVIHCGLYLLILCRVIIGNINTTCTYKPKIKLVLYTKKMLFKLAFHEKMFCLYYTHNSKYMFV